MKISEDRKELIEDSWLFSPSIIKRSAAVFGHFFLFYLMLALTLGIGGSIIIGMAS